jgi:hypothetical protein
MADRFPKFSLTGAVGLEALHFGNLFESGSLTSRLGPRIRWPLFQGGRIRANIQAVKARSEAGKNSRPKRLVIPVHGTQDLKAGMQRALMKIIPVDETEL